MSQSDSERDEIYDSEDENIDPNDMHVGTPLSVPAARMYTARDLHRMSFYTIPKLLTQ